MVELKKIVSLLSNPTFLNIFKNTGWGVISNIIQNILYTIFFIAVARRYSATDFSTYIISNNLYGFVLSFSSLGLGQWFLREMQITKDKIKLRNQFLKIQFAIGIIFYLINLLLAKFIYNSDLILKFSMVLGMNIIFDNIISVFKFFNINEGAQYKSFIFLSVDAILKFILAILVANYSINMSVLIIVIVSMKFISLTAFFKYGLHLKIRIIETLKTRISYLEIHRMVFKNIAFVLIGSISVIFWSTGNIIVSKMLTINDIAYYDIIFKIFVMAQIIPVIFSTTIFAELAKAAIYDKGDLKNKMKYFHSLYFFYGLTSYVFIYSYADIIIPILFGYKYLAAATFCKQMFLTILVFPTVLLQANVLIAIKKERIDMWMNLIVLVINVACCLVGIKYFKDLSAINYSVFIAFLSFLIMQDIFLLKLNIQELKSNLKKYMIIIIASVSCNLLALNMNVYWIFPIYVAILIIYFMVKIKDKIEYKVIKTELIKS